jgi:multisubunit Na+/H+ antiporter MnhB subunit
MMITQIHQVSFALIVLALIVFCLAFREERIRKHASSRWAAYGIALALVVFALVPFMPGM